jgi:TPR repeat protein
MHISRLLVGVVIAVLLRGNAIGGLEDCAAAFDRQDYAAAHQLCRPLAEQGDARAQTSLAGMYYNGQGIQRDYAEAAKWVRRAAEQGYAPAQADLRRPVLQRPRRAAGRRSSLHVAAFGGRTGAGCSGGT